MAEVEYHTTACIVYPAVFQGSDEKSHCTAMFLGEVYDHAENEAAIRTAVEYLRHEFLAGGTFVQVATAFDWFGPEKDTLVMKFEYPARLFRLRAGLENMLALAGVEWPGTWAYSPHVTLTKMEVPERVRDTLAEARPNIIVRLEPPVLWWGEDRPGRTVK